MSRQLLIVIKCNNYREVVRGIYKPTNANEKQSKFQLNEIENLEDEVRKVLENIKGYKAIKFAWNVSDDNGEIESNQYIIDNKCYSNGTIINAVIRKYANKINDIGSV